MSIRGYDRESGLCYNEVTSNAGPMTADWTWKTKGSSREHQRYKSTGPGCSSLRNMAIRVTLSNFLSITTETLTGVPWEVAKELWHRIVACKLDCLLIWKVFASAYPQELGTTLVCKEEEVLKPNMDLTGYTTHLTSPSAHWVTFLTISNITCSRPELVQLSKFINLGVLTIGRGLDIDFDDGVIRAWMHAAVDSNAFSMLRVLKLYHRRNISGVSFGYLAYFPCLAMINFDECSINYQDKPEALRWGWNDSIGVNTSNLLVGGGRTDSVRNSFDHACFHWSGAFTSPHLTAESVKATDSLPVLHFDLGASASNAAGWNSIVSFQRLTSCSATLEAAKKRLVSDRSQSSAKSRKKPMLRASKQQDMGNVLMGFGS